MSSGSDIPSDAQAAAYLGYFKAVQRYRHEQSDDTPDMPDEQSSGAPRKKARTYRKKRIRTGTDEYGRPEYDVRKVPVDDDEGKTT